MITHRRSPGTIDVVYRIDPSRRLGRKVPRTPTEAQKRLVHGNHTFAQLLDVRRRPSVRVVMMDPGDVGFGAQAGDAPSQRPFAAVLGCSDARVPVEMIFQQRANDLFVVRVAGNGVGSGCLGSLRYAAAHFSGTLRLIVVLGHSQCGAVTAAVDAFLKPKNYLPLAANYPLRAIVDAILVAARSASLALEWVHGPRVSKRPGYRAALIEASVVLNAALSAFGLRQEFENRRCHVVFGSYDLGSRAVRLPLAPTGGTARSEIGLFAAPGQEDEFRQLATNIAASAHIEALLDTHAPEQHRKGH